MLVTTLCLAPHSLYKLDSLCLSIAKPSAKAMYTQVNAILYHSANFTLHEQHAAEYISATSSLY